MPAPKKSYCEAIRGFPDSARETNRRHHDRSHGFPAKNDDELFAKLVLEMNQAGLSWTTILKKEKAFRRAFHGFRVAKVARYKSRDVKRLLGDAGIIRNRLKVRAAIHNANVVLRLQKEHGSFHGWLVAHRPRPIEEWVKLFRATFKFMGYEIVNEFLMSTGHIRGAHHSRCPVHKKILRLKPVWARR